MKWIKPDWTAPDNVHALTTTRLGGASCGDFAENNLGCYNGDAPEAVAKNREQLLDAFNLPEQPLWLRQTHSTKLVYARTNLAQAADASITCQRHLPLAILTADCLPIIICSQHGDEIAAVHAGWRGLTGGILENTLNAMRTDPAALLAWIGPGICGDCFEIGEAIIPKFQRHPDFTKAMLQEKSGRYSMNLAFLARKILENQGLSLIESTSYCTFERQDLFYSYRRQAKTGRMATLIWLT